MKTIVTIIFVLFIGFAAQAQDTTQSAEVATEINVNIEKKDQLLNEVENNSVARLYKRKNTRIKKELTFTTKSNGAKLS